MYKLLALDMDGTALSSDNSLSPYLQSVLKEVSRKIDVIFATGRHHIAVEPYQRMLNLTTPSICCNGTYVFDFSTHKIVMGTGLKKKDALQFYQMVSKADIKHALYVEDAIFYSLSSPPNYIDRLAKWSLSLPTDSRPKIEVIDSFKKAISGTQHVWKLLLEGQHSDLEAIIKDNWVKKTFSLERSWSNRVDCVPIGNSKGNRLAQYIGTIGVKPEEVVAAGDNYNDLSMIIMSGLGIAMENAKPSVKKQADIICSTDNNGHGLARLIEELFL